jgi:hypothetical protein
MTKKTRHPAYVNRPSQITGKKPSPRLKARRRYNTTLGAFPNPSPKTHKNYYIGQIDKEGTKIVKYFDGSAWTPKKKDAVIWHSIVKARSIAKKIADRTGMTLGVLTEEKKYLPAGLETKTPKPGWSKKFIKAARK